jgi:hypothetical protein
VFADAHPGQPVNVLRSMLPVASEASPPTAPLIADLDPLSPANGYNPNGRVALHDDFSSAYLAAQAKRMNATIDEAIRRLDALKSNRTAIPTTTSWSCRARGNPGAGPAGTIYMNQFDPGIASMNSTRRPQKLLKNDGTVVTETVKSVIVPDQKIVPTALSFALGTHLHAAFVPERERRSGDRLAGGHRSLHGEQLDQLRGAVDLGAGAVRRDGCLRLRARQRGLFEMAKSATRS